MPVSIATTRPHPCVATRFAASRATQPPSHTASFAPTSTVHRGVPSGPSATTRRPSMSAATVPSPTKLTASMRAYAFQSSVSGSLAAGVQRQSARPSSQRRTS